jgi:hypothetical protein
MGRVGRVSRMVKGLGGEGRARVGRGRSPRRDQSTGAFLGWIEELVMGWGWACSRDGLRAEGADWG